MSEANDEVKHLANQIISLCEGAEVIAIAVASVIGLAVAIFIGVHIWAWMVAHWQQMAAVAIMNAMFIAWAFLQWDGK